MLPSGGHVSIGGVEYSLADQERPYIHRYESLFSQSTAIAGEIAKNQLRPEKLLWSLTDFSGGEGSPIYYPQDSTAYDIGSGVNVTTAGLVTTRPRRRVTSVARSGSTATVAQRPAGGAVWDKAVIFWGDNGLFSRDAIGWTAGTGSSSYATVNLFDADSDGRYMIAGVVLEGATGNVLLSVDGTTSPPTYADIFTGSTILDAPFVTEVLDGVWYAWGIDSAATPTGALCLIKGAALSTTSTGTLIFNTSIAPQGGWGSTYWTDIETAEGKLFMSLATPSGTTIYTSETDVGRTFYTSEPGFVCKKMVYKLGVLFLLGCQVGAGKQFASIIAIPLATESPIEVGSPRKHKNTELSSWEAGCAGPGSTLFLGDVNSGKIFTYDLKRDAFNLFDDLANGGTGDGMSFTPYANLLRYGTSSMEVSSLALAGWTAESGTWTFQTTGTPRNGFQHLRCTATGVIVTGTGTGGIPVTEGTTYTFFAYFKSSNAFGSTTPFIRWYDSSGTLLSTSSASLTALTTSFAQVSVSDVAPADATYAAVGTTSTNASGNNHFMDDASFHAGSSVANADRIAFLATHGSRLFGATWQPQGTGTSLQTFAFDDLVKENRDASQAISASLESGEWDYGLPQEQKALIGFYVTYEVTDPATNSGLLADTRITISYATDEAISMTPTYTALEIITTDTVTTQLGRHFIAVSDTEDTTKFTRLKVKITLDNNENATAAPPIVYSVVAESQLMAYAETWDLVVKVEDEESGSDHPRTRQNRASFMRDNLLDLAINKEIVEFIDGTRVRFNDPPTTHTVIVEDPTDVISSPDTAEGYMAIKLRAVPV